MAPYHIFSSQGAPAHIAETLSREIPRGSTADDVRRFRAFVRLYTTPQARPKPKHPPAPSPAPCPYRSLRSYAPQYGTFSPPKP